MNVHVPVESMLGNPLSIRGLMRVGVYELKVAALAQSIGVGCFVSAAVIYGLIALPTPEAHRSATPPMPDRKSSARVDSLAATSRTLRSSKLGSRGEHMNSHRACGPVEDLPMRPFRARRALQRRLRRRH